MDALRRFFVVSIGIACAMAAAFIFLPLAGFADPALREAGIGILIFSAFALLFASMAGAAIDPFGFAYLAIWLLTLAVLGAPVIIAALVGEAARIRSIVYHMAAPGVLAAAMPFIFALDTMGASEDGLPPFPLDRLALLLFLTGAVAGFVYWLAAGRSSGRDQSVPAA